LKNNSYSSVQETDVLVVGGGTAGFPAAVASGRQGVKTILVERFQHFGGMMTGGLVSIFHTMRIHKDIKTKNVYQFTGYQESQVIRGIAQEICDRLLDMNGSFGIKGEATSKMPYDPEIMKVLADEMLEESNVDIWLQSLATDVIVENSKITGVIISNKSGNHLIKPRFLIDASGDADIVYWAGSPCEFGDKAKDGRTMSISLLFTMNCVNFSRLFDFLKKNPELLDYGDIFTYEKIWKEGKPFDFGGFAPLIKEAINNGDFPIAYGAQKPFPLCYILTIIRNGKVAPNETLHIADMAYNVNATDAKQLSKCLVGVRKHTLQLAQFFRKYIPGFEEAYISQTASQLGIRETRRIIGDYVITEDDVLEGRKFEDAIGRAGRAINVHSETGGDETEKKGGQIWKEIKGGRSYDIPFRALLPQGLENVLVAGRCISCQHIPLGSSRGEPICIVTGEAAGVASALCAKKNLTTRNLPIKELQKELLNQGVDLGDSFKTE